MTATEYVFVLLRWFGEYAVFFPQIKNDNECMEVIAALLALAED